MLWWAGEAYAHGVEQHTGNALWTFDPFVVVPLVGAGLAFAVGTARLLRRAGGGRQALARQTAFYAVGWLALGCALVSPLHELGEQLFTFHMVEHEIIMAIAAPLVVLARPSAPLLWSLPAAARAVVKRTVLQKRMRGALGFLTRPRNATILHGLAIWFWHVPQFFDAAVGDVMLHRLQHLSFLATALLFWWSLLRRSESGEAAWHLFVTMIHTGALGALIALAPHVAYSLQSEHALEFGLTPLEDQQLAGLIMWIPAGTVYATAALFFAALWIKRSGAWRPYGTLQRP
jgi:cytochrome c oxidase assembly factor CtaG